MNNNAKQVQCDSGLWWRPASSERARDAAEKEQQADAQQRTFPMSRKCRPESLGRGLENVRDGPFPFHACLGLGMRRWVGPGWTAALTRQGMSGPANDGRPPARARGDRWTMQGRVTSLTVATTAHPPSIYPSFFLLSFKRVQPTGCCCITAIAKHRDSLGMPLLTCLTGPIVEIATAAAPATFISSLVVPNGNSLTIRT
jgi:hypothetical protein